MKGTLMKNFFYFITISIVLFYSSLNAQWTRTNGPPGDYGYFRTFAVSDTNLFAGNDGGGGVFLSTNNGTSWTAVNTGLSSWYVEALAFSGTDLFAGTGGGGICHSTNNGISWTEVNNGLTNTTVWSFGVSGTNLFAGTAGGVFLSTNNGASWTSVSDGLTNIDVRTFGVIGTNLFAGTFGGGVFRSTNNGTNWTPANNGLTNTNIFALAVAGTNLFAGTGSRVFISTNNGTSWAPANNGMTYYLVYSIVVYGTNLFAGTIGGVFLSTNNGTNWTEANTGLTNTPVSLVVSGNYLFAGTDSNRVWRRSLSEMITSVEDRSSEIPSQFVLEQNYPNPFNPSTKIDFTILERSNVSLKIFNLLGSEVASLINEEKPVGTYEITWYAANLPSGIYFYKLEAGNYTETKKMMLIK
jgi:hypothetical protein